MKKSRLLAVLTSGTALSLGLALGPVTTAAHAATSTVKHGGVLHVVMPWVTIPDNFNPLNPGTNSATAGGTGSAIYEPLAYDNTYTGAFTPVLATAWQWSSGNKTLTVTTRHGVNWNDGKPFSAADVAFTFNYLKKNPAVDSFGDWKTPLVSVKATSPDTVVFRYQSPDTVVLPFVLSQLIVPEHIFSKVANPVTFTNLKPVGTGPFLLKSYNSTAVTYVKNMNYWMTGRPYINGITIQAVKSNDTAELLLLNGDAAYTYDAITDPNTTYVKAHPAWNKYWWPSISQNILYMNTQVAPFNDVNLRKAVAMSLNDSVIADRAYFGSVAPANGAQEAGVTAGQTSEWVPSSLSSLEWTYNPSGALSLLESHGYKLVNGSLVGPSGTTLPNYKILVGSGWTDFISIAQTMSQELLAIGIHTTIDQEPWSTYYGDAQGGTYDFLVCWSNGNNATPYYEYYYMLSSAEAVQAGTKNVNTNYERYTSPAVDSILSNFSATTTLSQQKADMVSIEKTVLNNVVAVPLTGRPNWFDYSTRFFTGWPSTSDPYNAGEAPDAFNGGAEQLYLNVHLK
jgi:peptide/nickel transport system substrate-binding protein